MKARLNCSKTYKQWDEDVKNKIPLSDETMLEQHSNKLELVKRPTGKRNDSYYTMNQIMTYISTNDITESNELIYAGVKLVCEKIGIPSKSTEEKSKPGWEIRVETQIKKSTKTGQNDKTKERR